MTKQKEVGNTEHLTSHREKSADIEKSLTDDTIPEALARKAKRREALVSKPREEITHKELHSLLIHRIYHEDTLLQQRNANFLTVNAFLSAGFAALLAIEPTKIAQASIFGYVLTVFGFFWALLQVAYGKKQVTATSFWREQARMAEKALHTKFDYTLFEFYDYGKTKTSFGVIKMSSKIKKPPNRSFPYTLPFFSSANMLFAVTVPWMIAVFWTVLTVIMMLCHQAPLIPVVLPIEAVMIILLMVSYLGSVAYSEGILDEHTPSSTTKDMKNSVVNKKSWKIPVTFNIIKKS